MVYRKLRVFMNYCRRDRPNALQQGLLLSSTRRVGIWTKGPKAAVSAIITGNVSRDFQTETLSFSIAR